jgi:hypothetical protein
MSRRGEATEQGARSAGNGLPGLDGVGRAGDEHGAPGERAEEQTGCGRGIVDGEPTCGDRCLERGDDHAECVALAQFGEAGRTRGRQWALGVVSDGP